MQHQIGLIRGIFLVTITFIGTGIMAVPAMTATLAGSQAILVWFTLAVCSLPIAFVFAKLGQTFPSQGGVSEYVGLSLQSPRFKSIGQLLVAYLFLSTMITGLPPAIGIATANLGQALGLSPSSYPALSFAALALVSLIVVLGIKFSALVQTSIVLVIVGLLVMLWMRGAPTALPLPEMTNAQDWLSPPMRKAFAAAMWAFVGLEALSHLSQDFKNPHKTVPIALITGMLLATLCYVVTLILVLSQNTYGDELTDTASLSLMFNQLYGNGGRQVVGFVGFLAGIAVIAVYFTSSTRLIQYLAKQQKAPVFLAKTNRFNTPHWALLLIAFISATSLSVKYLFDFQFVTLISYTNGLFMLIYAMAMVSAFKLLRGLWKGVALIGLIVCAVFICNIIYIL